MDEYARFRNWGRIGGLTAWAKNGPEVMLGGARKARQAKYEQLADPTGELPEEERRKRADRLLRADMLRLAARSAEVRRSKKSPVPSEIRTGLVAGRASSNGRTPTT